MLKSLYEISTGIEFKVKDGIDYTEHLATERFSLVNPKLEKETKAKEKSDKAKEKALLEANTKNKAQPLG